MNNMLFFLVFFPMLAAPCVWILERRSKTARDVCAMVCAALELALLVFVIFSGENVSASCAWLCGLGVNFELDGFRKLYCGITAFMWLMTLVFSGEYFRHYKNVGRYYFFNLITLGATLGVFMSADLYTTFIFFEIMSVASYAWVAHEETPAAMRAAGTYLAIAVIGGLVALMGLFLLNGALATLEFARMHEAALSADRRTVYIACFCLLFGFGAKAGMFPLHVWLPKAHPIAPAPASALLSGVLTKTGVFGILVVSCNILHGDVLWGGTVLGIGTVTMLLGALMALFSVNLKHTLACSSMSQIGFILVGVGMMCLLGDENALAARGVVLHMTNHSLIKLVLFMAAGIVYINTHELELDGIRGFGRKKPFLMICFLLGAVGIGGVPLMNGYISKTLLHESIVEYLAHASGAASVLIGAVEWIFLISGGLTVAYMTKLFVAVFVEKNASAEKQAVFDEKRTYMSPLTKAALGVSSVVLPILGLFGNAVSMELAEASMPFLNGGELHHAVHWFAFVNLKGALISVGIGAVVYVVIVRRILMARGDGQISYVNRIPSWLDLEDVLYRPVVLKLLPNAFGYISEIIGGDKVLGRVCAAVFRTAEILMHAVSDCIDLIACGIGLTVLRAENRYPEAESEEKVRLSDVWRTRAREADEVSGASRNNLAYALLATIFGIVGIMAYMFYVM